MENLIYEKEDVLDKKICDEIIARFENDINKKPGITGGGLNKNIKDSLDLIFSKLNGWEDIDSYICNLITNNYIEYIDEYKKLINDNEINPLPIEMYDTGYQIQKYNQNEGKYIWHTDDDGVQSLRYLTFIIYLNTVDKGGETEFTFKQIKPKCGKLLFFPATWTYPHRGKTPESSDKYIITGWLSRTLM